MSVSNRRDFIHQTAVLAGGLGCAASAGRNGTAHEFKPDRGALTQLRAKLEGTLVLPEDAAYENAKRVFYWNPKTARRPVAVVRCSREDDARHAIEFARKHDLEVAVRSGGHSHLAWSSSNGLVLDLSPLKQITVDPVKRVVHAQGGALGGEVARAAGAYGLVPVLGQCRGVSATGVTLGGGLGWLSGLFGACCDNLVSARMLTADAQSLDVDSESDPDLFWALRGAGANFGVTTSVVLRLHAIGPVLGGDVHFAVRDARAVLRGFREIMLEAPDGFQATLNLTPGERGLFISLCHAGDDSQAEQLMQRIRAIAKPTRESVHRQSYAQLAERAPATNSGSEPVPAFRAVQTVYRERITDEMIDLLVDQLAQASPDVIMGLSHYMHGQVCRVAPDATAFPHRQAHAVHLRGACSWSDPAESQQKFTWGEEWLRLLRPKSQERIYANYQTYQTEAGARSLFDANYTRLLELKNKHDPSNFFRRNANIVPT